VDTDVLFIDICLGEGWALNLFDLWQINLKAKYF